MGQSNGGIATGDTVEIIAAELPGSSEDWALDGSRGTVVRFENTRKDRASVRIEAKSRIRDGSPVRPFPVCALKKISRKER